jgi:hypothetical protein
VSQPAAASLDVLFIPVSGPTGSGEIRRCELLAEALRQRDATLRIGFVLSERAVGLSLGDVRVTHVPISPTRNPGEVIAAIGGCRPRLVVFDGNARRATLRAARAAGARVVLISSRRSARRRGFRFSRLRWLDAHWQVAADLPPAPGRLERLKLALYPRVQWRSWHTLFAEPSPARAARWIAELGLSAGGFVACCPGGGLQQVDGRPAAVLMADVARAAAATLGAAVCMVGPGASERGWPTGSVGLEELRNADLMALIRHARFVLTGGGSLLAQSLACHAACLAVPWQREQTARVRPLARAGLCRLVPPDPPSMLGAMRDWLAHPDAVSALRERVTRSGITNGLDDAVTALQDCLAPGSA